MLSLVDLPLEQRRAFLTALLYVATSDDEYHSAEQAFVQRAIDASQLSEDAREAVLLTLKTRPPLETILAPLMGTPVARLLVRELVSLAYADGSYVEAERSGVTAISDQLGLPRAWLGQVEDWVAEGDAWHRRGESLFASA